LPIYLVFTMLSLFALVLLLVVPSSALASRSVSGYLIYCPCMGRFGNQAEQFLGVLAFARQLRRTLVVPPWISYGRPGAGIDLTPFGRHFNLTKLDAAHPVIDMRQFVDKLSPALWPAGSRAVFCHSAREDGTCQAKVGNPFGPFWDAFGVNFDRDEFYGNTAGSSLGDSESWQRNYPSNRWPVLAFMGAPASFPAQPKHLGLHRHVAFNEEFLESLNLLMEANDLQRPSLAFTCATTWISREPAAPCCLSSQPVPALLQLPVLRPVQSPRPAVHENLRP
ncbi:hypothetical protein BOX15_Mlig006951g1, partial [Macrostomum lignano]